MHYFLRRTDVIINKTRQCVLHCYSKDYTWLTERFLQAQRNQICCTKHRSPFVLLSQNAIILLIACFVRLRL